jgi:hypothetical protein
LLTDAIFIALDNVKAHCGIKREPNVWINCTVEPESRLLQLDIRNTVSSTAKTKEAEEKLGKIRSMIDSGDFGRATRREGGSGFLKLAAALREVNAGKVSFDFSGPTEFLLSLQFKLTVLTLTVIKA